MNKITSFLLITLLTTVLIGCSSGSSTTDSPQNLTGQYEGSFENADGSQTGVAVFNLVQRENSRDISGNAIFDRAGGNTCLFSGVLEDDASVTGFTASFTINNVNFQLNIENNANTLSGTYVLSEATDVCGLSTGSGNITVRRN